MLAIYLGWGAAIALLWLRVALALPGWALALPILAALVALVGLVRFFANPARVWGRANDPGERLDERELRVRDRAYLEGYRLIATVLVLGLLYAGFARDLGLWLPRGWGEFQALFWSALLLAITLPAAIVARTEADSPADDEVDGDGVAASGLGAGRSLRAPGSR